MDGEFPEQFKCPVCLEIPEKEIYQCENGHTTCDSCSTGLSHCPQCRVDLSTKKIRNRALEDLLDMMKFNCSFKSEGCNTKVARKEVSSHSDNCTFGGEQVPLCKYLGFTCKYRMKTRNLLESIRHLKDNHSMLQMNDINLEIRLKSIKKIDQKVRGLWKPVLLNVHFHHYMLVVHSIKGNISILCIWISENSNPNVDVKFRITSKIDKIPDLEWAAKTISPAECELALQFPPLLVSLDYLLAAHVEADADVLKIQVIISDSKSTNKVSNTTVTELVLESFMVLPSSEQHPNDRSSMSDMLTLENMTALLLSQFCEQIGDTYYCNVCQTSPIIGPRYQCLQCRGYDLCSTCMAKNEHSFHHFTLLCTVEQVKAMHSVVARTKPRKSFLECGNNGNLGTGYALGSICSDAKELSCQKCEKQPDFICLQCVGPYGLCRFCFLGELTRHNGSHCFVMTMIDSARQFALYLLRKHNILPQLKYELDS